MGLSNVLKADRMVENAFPVYGGGEGFNEETRPGARFYPPGRRGSHRRPGASAPVPMAASPGKIRPPESIDPLLVGGATERTAESLDPRRAE